MNNTGKVMQKFSSSVNLDSTPHSVTEITGRQPFKSRLDQLLSSNNNSVHEQQQPSLTVNANLIKLIDANETDGELEEASVERAAELIDVFAATNDPLDRTNTSLNCEDLPSQPTTSTSTTATTNSDSLSLLNTNMPHYHQHHFNHHHSAGGGGGATPPASASSLIDNYLNNHHMSNGIAFNSNSSSRFNNQGSSENLASPSASHRPVPTKPRTIITLPHLIGRVNNSQQRDSSLPYRPTNNATGNPNNSSYSESLTSVSSNNTANSTPRTPIIIRERIDSTDSNITNGMCFKKFNPIFEIWSQTFP
jgi:hypothetical protein